MVDMFILEIYSGISPSDLNNTKIPGEKLKIDLYINRHFSKYHVKYQLFPVIGAATRFNDGII